MLNFLTDDPVVFFLFVAAFLLSITLHEFAHAFAATTQGDPTAKEHGRLTLNPIAHIDPTGAILFLFFGFGWAKPVPFNPLYLRSRRFGAAIVSGAGPLANLFQVVICALLLKGLGPSLGAENLLIIFLVFLAQINIILMFFNLIPIPPLDGSKIFFSLLPRSLVGVQNALERYGPWVIIAILAFEWILKIGIISPFLRSVSTFVFGLLT